MTRNLVAAALLAGVAVLVAACAGYAPGVPDAIGDGVRPGPGLFSGDDGVFTIFGGDEKAAR